MFRSLPPEIQLFVAASLKAGDKVNLIYTCHYFYDLVIPQLYENLPDAMYLSAQLVDALVRNPALQKYPRYIRIEAWISEDETDSESESDEDRDGTPAQEEDDIGNDPTDPMPQVGLFCKHAKEICVSDDDGSWWAKDIRKGYVDAWIALLLTLAPNLTRLEVQFPFNSRGWVQRVVRWTVERRFAKPVLRQVAQVFVSGRWSDNKDEGADEVVTDWTLPFLALPALQRFGTDALREVHYKVDEPVPPSSAIHLAVWNCAGLQDVERFIAKCPNLVSYRHESGQLSLPFRRTYRALLGVKDSLKEIWLHVWQARHAARVKWPSFREFAALETLHVPIFLLEDFDGEARDVDLSALLPPTLRTLHVTGAVHSTLPSLFLSLLQYVKTPRTEVTEFIVATTHVDPARETVRAVMDARKRPHNDLTADEASNSIFEAVADLQVACSERAISFEYSQLLGSDLGNRWRFPDPFYQTR
ncbi:hypothetical protein BDV12DRAFT_198082 [Aspergillus spectabilis]